MRGQQEMDLEEGQSVIMDSYYLDGNNGLMHYWWIYFLHTWFFTSQDINWWTGEVWIIMMFYQLFGLSFWRHPFTTDDPLVSKWCKATFLQICSDEETNSSTFWMTWGWVNVHFWENYSFKKVYLDFMWTEGEVCSFCNTCSKLNGKNKYSCKPQLVDSRRKRKLL